MLTGRTVVGTTIRLCYRRGTRYAPTCVLHFEQGAAAAILQQHNSHKLGFQHNVWGEGTRALMSRLSARRSHFRSCCSGESHAAKVCEGLELGQTVWPETESLPYQSPRQEGGDQPSAMEVALLDC